MLLNHWHLIMLNIDCWSTWIWMQSLSWTCFNLLIYNSNLDCQLAVYLSELQNFTANFICGQWGQQQILSHSLCKMVIDQYNHWVIDFIIVFNIHQISHIKSYNNNKKLHEIIYINTKRHFAINKTAIINIGCVYFVMISLIKTNNYSLSNMYYTL